MNPRTTLVVVRFPVGWCRLLKLPRLVQIACLSALLTMPAAAQPNPADVVGEVQCAAASASQAWTTEPTTGLKWRPLTPAEKAAKGVTGEAFFAEKGTYAQARNGVAQISLLVPSCSSPPVVFHLNLLATESGSRAYGIHTDGTVDVDESPSLFWYASEGTSLPNAKGLVAMGYGPWPGTKYVAALASSEAAGALAYAVLDANKLAVVTFQDLVLNMVKVTALPGSGSGGGGGGGEGGGGGGGGPPAQCADAVDNDGDGWNNLEDPACSSASDNDEWDDPYQYNPFLIAGEIRWCTKFKEGDQWKTLAYARQTQIIQVFADNGGVLVRPQGAGVACWLAASTAQADDCTDASGCTLSNGHQYPFGGGNGEPYPSGCGVNGNAACFVYHAWNDVDEMRNFVSIQSLKLVQVLFDATRGGCGQGAFPEGSGGPPGASAAWAPPATLNCASQPTSGHEMGHNHGGTHELATYEGACKSAMHQWVGSADCFVNYFSDSSRWEINEACILNPTYGNCPRTGTG